MPWVMVTDHVHYARNLPVHLRDMTTLEERHPALFVEFLEGHFVGQKSKRSFSMLPLDQMHEQLNDWLKNDAGTIGNLDDPRTVRREQVSRPEMARIISELEKTQNTDEPRHHEQFPKFQANFQSDVRSLTEAFLDLGNPFLEESSDLLDLDQSIIMPTEVVDNVRNVTTIGKTPASRKSTEATIKDQQAKTSQILLAAQSGRNVSESLFQHESSELPPAFTRQGKMYHGTKSEIIDCIVFDTAVNARPDTSCAVLDGPVLVQMLRPGNATTIGDYCTGVLFPYVLRWLEHNERVDIIWDVYSKTSLKSSTREQRGSGTRRRVTHATKIPGNWAAFLRVDKNKQELFVELAKSMHQMVLPQGKQLFTTILNDCVSIPADADLSMLTPCYHEEADTRIILHVAAAASAGHRKVIIRTSDSDVVVLAVWAVATLQHRVDEIWVALGTGQNFRYIPAHEIVRNLGPSKSMALPAFHALTGCDTVSSFYGKGKKSAWAVWQSLPDLDLPLQLLSCANPTFEMIARHTPVFQLFVMKLYGVEDDDITTVDAARLHLFFHKGRDFDHMPPSSDALHQHVLRTAYQSGHVWGNSLQKDPQPAPPTEWGWTKTTPDTAPAPVYCTLPSISRNIGDLAICGCATDCKRPCKCCINGQPCTTLCGCNGFCRHTRNC